MRLWLLEHPAVCSGLFQQYIFKQLFFNFNNFSGTSSCFRQQITDMAWTSCFIDFNSPGQTCLQRRPRTLAWPSWTADWRYRKADTAEFFGGHNRCGEAHNYVTDHPWLYRPAFMYWLLHVLILFLPTRIGEAWHFWKWCIKRQRI